MYTVMYTVKVIYTRGFALTAAFALAPIEVRYKGTGMYTVGIHHKINLIYFVTSRVTCCDTPRTSL
jgi:hypothetical protein